MRRKAPRLYPRRPTRLLGKRRVAALHGMARERMNRRRSIWIALMSAEEAMALLGFPSKARLMQRYLDYAHRLHGEAEALEQRLWLAYPDCEVCTGTGRVMVNGFAMECPKCEGQGKDRRG